MAVAEMYAKGVLTRQADAVPRELGIEVLPLAQVNCATTDPANNDDC